MKNRRALFGRANVLVLFLSAANGISAQNVDRILIFKSKHQMQLLRAGQVLKTYQIALGSSRVGPKHFHGDHRTPEGTYFIDARNAQSHFYKALHISYPNPSDLKYAQAQHRSPGGAVMIHGLPNGYGYLGRLHLTRDWTDGCIAVTNEQMDEIWKEVPMGTLVEIRP